jgi:hypothetical protein
MYGYGTDGNTSGAGEKGSGKTKQDGGGLKSMAASAGSKLKAKSASRGASIKSGLGKAGSTLKSGKMSALKSAGSGVGKGFGKATDGFKNVSGTLYKWIFTLFIMFAVGIFIMPTFVMIIIGILTFRIAQGSLRNTVSM